MLLVVYIKGMQIKAKKLKKFAAYLSLTIAYDIIISF